MPIDPGWGGPAQGRVPAGSSSRHCCLRFLCWAQLSAPINCGDSLLCSWHDQVSASAGGFCSSSCQVLYLQFLIRVLSSAHPSRRWPSHSQTLFAQELAPKSTHFPPARLSSARTCWRSLDGSESFRAALRTWSVRRPLGCWEARQVLLCLYSSESRLLWEHWQFVCSAVRLSQDCSSLHLPPRLSLLSFVAPSAPLFHSNPTIARGKTGLAAPGYERVSLHHR